MIKKFIFSILFLLLACKLLFAGVISVDKFISADDVTIAHLETMRSTFQGAINSPDGALIQPGTINVNSLDDNTSTVTRWNETFTDFVYTGLIIPESSDLNSTTPAGTAYIEGVRVVKEATPHLYGASKDTYVDLSSTGTYTYTAVANGAAVPVVADNSIRIAMVSSDTTSIVGVDDLRTTIVSLSSIGISTIADIDGNTNIKTEKASDENIIRFDTAGTERMVIGSTGIVNIANLTASKPVFTDASKNLVSTGTLATDQGGTGVSVTAGEGVWADYFASSTIVGWTTPTGTIYTKKIGKTVFVSYSLSGTSNSVDTTFTVPYTISNTVTPYAVGYAVDNTGAASHGLIEMVKNAAVIYLDPTMVGGADWTAGGTKTAVGQFWYESV